MNNSQLPKLGVQLYTLRSIIKSGQNLLEVLPKVASLGYRGVEFAGYHGLPAEELAACLSENSLECAGSHVSLKELTGAELEKNLNFIEKLGGKYLGVGMAPTRTKEDMNTLCATMKAASIEGAKRGITIYYHNHTAEFKLVDGARKIDIIKHSCALELDTFWSFIAKADTPRYIRENAEFIKLIHIKDGGKIIPKPSALGLGKNDLKGIIAAAKDIDSEWLIVENDFPKSDALADIEISMKYLKENV